MPTLHIRLTKKPDGSSVLACTREEGSETWQWYQTDFSPIHDDVNHFALETVLGIDRKWRLIGSGVYFRLRV